MKPILLLATALAAPAFAQQDRFTSDHVWDFNGRSWSGIQLSRTTWRELQRDYDARAYTIHDYTLRVVPRRPERLNVYAIFPEQRDDARVEAIRLDYYGDEPSLDEFNRQIREEGQEYWHPARNSDWSILAFRRSGVIAVVRGSGRERTATTYFLVEPERMTQILAPYSARPADRLSVDGLLGGSRPYRDPDSWRGDFAAFGRVTIDNRVDGRMPRGMGPDDMRDFRSWAEDRFRDKDSGSMRYEERSLGTVRVSARWNDFERNGDEGDLDITASFTSSNGENISVKDTHHVDINGNYQRAWEGAINNVLKTLEERTNEQVRERRNDNDRQPDRRQYDRELSLSEAMDELAKAAVGRTGFERGGRIIERGGG
jgi:hypothetical protein